MVEAVDKEQLTGTVATLSCTVTGLTQKLDGVKWTKSDNAEITSGADNFIIDTGSGSFSDGTQTTTLTVPGAQTDQDKIYKCLVTSDEHGGTEESRDVNLKVFSKQLCYNSS